MEMVRQYSRRNRIYTPYTSFYTTSDVSFEAPKPKPQDLTKRYLRIQRRQFDNKYALAA